MRTEREERCAQHQQKKKLKEQKRSGSGSCSGTGHPSRMHMWRLRGGNESHRGERQAKRSSSRSGGLRSVSFRCGGSGGGSLRYCGSRGGGAPQREAAEEEWNPNGRDSDAAAALCHTRVRAKTSANMLTAAAVRKLAR